MGDCKDCIRCGEIFPSDSMTPDAFGDSSVCMCHVCLSELKETDKSYMLVQVPEIYGTTFIFKNQLEELKEEVGEENITIIRA